VKSIEVDVSPSGDVKIEAHGFTGGACLAATKEIEEAIGKIEGRKLKEGSGPVNAVQKLQQ
jgi:hypothetical protein